eukprot:4149623-Amphidinium_carterae.1
MGSHCSSTWRAHTTRFCICWSNCERDFNWEWQHGHVVVVMRSAMGCCGVAVCVLSIVMCGLRRGGRGWKVVLCGCGG